MFLQRSKKIVLDFMRRHAGTDDCVAMVSHGNLIDQFVNELTGARREPDNYDNHWVANWAFHNTSITRIDFVSGSRAIVYTNQLQHLPPELVSW
jgi:broad specificity phosphatase PhoE